MEGEDAAVIGGGNSALQVVDNLHAVARDIHLLSTSELTADPAVVERVSCLSNLHTYIGYKVLEFTGDRTLSGVTIRKKAGEVSDMMTRIGIMMKEMSGPQTERLQSQHQRQLQEMKTQLEKTKTRLESQRK